LENEQGGDESVETELPRLLRETRLWRVANSAQWVAWGIVQAKIPRMEEALKSASGGVAQGEQSQAEGPLADDQEDEFDYLAYAQDRALFFWADILSLGLIREDDLPPEIVEHVKKRMIEY
jgi:choline kinase